MRAGECAAEFCDRGNTMASDGDKGYLAGRGGDDDIRAIQNESDGTILAGNGGNDILRGGPFDDILRGGSDNDQMFGGDGADQFRFYGYEITGSSDTDRIFDLDFNEGDSLVFGNYAAGTFEDSDSVNAFRGGSDAILKSYDGIVDAVRDSELVGAFRQGNGNNNLVLQIDNGNNQIQQIVITGGWSQFVAAGGTTDALVIGTTPL
ncbi:MAG: hypothetical protein ABW173_08380 [Sphingomonas sp.]